MQPAEYDKGDDACKPVEHDRDDSEDSHDVYMSCCIHLLVDCPELAD